jgi:dTDP-4-dehydrorhamnose reductase
MRILVLGSTGMLGSRLCKYLRDNNIEYDDTNSNTLSVDNFLFDPIKYAEKIYEFDCVVNCIGQIKPRFKCPDSVLAGYKINSMFPRLLADTCEALGIGLIHITTDCVFSGKTGMYTEDSHHDASDDYGLSKSLGEPQNCTVIRTSIIGEEDYNKYSLVEWAKSQKHKVVNGFTNHFWNGLTTKELSRVIVDVVRNKLFWNGVRHIHSSTDVNKSQLLRLISDRFELSLDIDEVEATPCNRTLRTLYSTNNRLQVPSVEQMIGEM